MIIKTKELKTNNCFSRPAVAWHGKKRLKIDFLSMYKGLPRNHYKLAIDFTKKYGYSNKLKWIGIDTKTNTYLWEIKE